MERQLHLMNFDDMSVARQAQFSKIGNGLYQTDAVLGKYVYVERWGA